MAAPIVHLYCLCWNEAAIIPFFLRHYDGLVSHFFIWDNHSTDGSPGLLQDHGRVTVTPFEVTGDSFVLEEQRLSDAMWQGSRGRADWVAVIDMDEFLHHPDLAGHLGGCTQDGVTAIRAIGYDMVADALPADGRLDELVTAGVRSLGYDKPCLFNPDAITATNFGLGRHGAFPTGDVAWPARPAVSLLHYKHLGRDYTRRRNRMLSQGLKGRDVVMGWASHYLRDDDQVDADFDRLRARAAPVPGLPGGPPAASNGCQEHMIRRSGRFNAAWYLAQYPDVADSGLDPVAHYHYCGWREGRLPHPGFDGRPYTGTDGAAPGASDPAAANPFLTYFIDTR